MDTKKDKIRENIMLCLLAIAPILIGYLFNVMLNIPVIGTIWMYAAPFTVLYFWGWAGAVFRAKFKSLWKSVLIGNLAGILCFIIFVVIGSRQEQTEITYLIGVLAQMYTLPLGFLTMWAAVIKEGVYDMSEASLSTAILVQAAGLILMIAAFAIGSAIAGKKED